MLKFNSPPRNRRPREKLCPATCYEVVAPNTVTFGKSEGEAVPHSPKQGVTLEKLASNTVADPV